MKKLIILGAGGHARVAAEVADLTGWDDVSLSIPEGLSETKKGHWTVQVASDDDTIRDSLGTAAFFVGVGDNVLRYKIVTRLMERGADLATLVHPRAVVSEYADLEAGVLCAAGAVVNPFAHIGMGTVINTGSSVDHDSRVGQCAHVAPRACLAADVVVGDLAFIGTGASIRNGVTIGAEAIVGLGAAVVSDVHAGQTVVGVPARPRREPATPDASVGT